MVRGGGKVQCPVLLHLVSLTGTCYLFWLLLNRFNGGFSLLELSCCTHSTVRRYTHLALLLLEAKVVIIEKVGCQ